MGSKNLKNALEQAGLTLEAFAEVIKVDPKSVGRWVNGNTIPYPRHRAAISRALGLEEHELWPDQAPSHPAPGEVAIAGCEVVGTWGYADDPAAPDPPTFITNSDGPVDILTSQWGLELTDSLAHAVAERARAGHPVRLLVQRF